MSLRITALLTALLLVLIAGPAFSADPDAILGIYELTPSFVNGGVLSAVRGIDGLIKGPVAFVDGPYGKALYFDGTSNSVVLYKGAPSGVTLPVKEFTIEAWVKIETRSSWTGIFNYVQDNGNYERGLYVGVVDGKLGGYVATKRDGSTPRLDWVAWDGPYDSEKWYHVAFTYDGAMMKLFIDGVMVRESNQASGEIVYPESSTLAIGAYLDDNETGPFKGAIREIRLYSRALTESEIRASVPGSVASKTVSVAPKPGTAEAVVVLKDGSSLVGILLRIEADELVLLKPDGKTEAINLQKVLAVLPRAN